MLKYNHKLKNFSRLLRSNQTESEKALWSKIRGKKIHGAQFYRQRPIGKYIVDFYAPAANLVIEVDGSQHLEAHAADKDREREGYLEAQGLIVLRFNSREVLLELDAVVEKINQVVEKKTERLNPP